MRPNATEKAFRLGREFQRHQTAAKEHLQQIEKAIENGWPSRTHPAAALAQERIQQAYRVLESLMRCAGPQIRTSIHAEMLGQLNNLSQQLRENAP